MSTVKSPEVTVKEVLQFRNIAGIYLRSEEKRDTKMYYTVEKMFKRLTVPSEKAMEDQQDLQREHAMTDEKTKKILKDGDSFQYTKEGMKELQEALRKLMSSPVPDIKPHYVTGDDIPKKLEIGYDDEFGRARVISHFDVKAAFEKFVLEPQPEDD